MRQLLCTLSDSEFAVRGAQWRELLASATERVETPDGVRLVFPPDARIAEQLDALIAKEASCCSWMAFDVERTRGAISVTVTGPTEARDGLVATFAVTSR
jgi:hypothetical protein